jgi:transcriptional regulator with XRE-family HTH domain
MEPDTAAAPPEARLIRTAREAVGMTAAQAAQATEGAVSATYWRDVERGYGGRRGQRAPAKASARLLAAMARVTGVTPDQLAGAQREDAARVLTEILRREGAPAAAPRPDIMPAASGPEEEFLASVLAMLSPKDQEVVLGIMRLVDGENRPWSWERKRELIESYAARVGERRPAAGLGSTFSARLLRGF